MKKYLIIIFLPIFLFGNNIDIDVSSCTENGDGTITYELDMKSDVDFYGFQFTINPGDNLFFDTSYGSGGLAQDFGWMVTFGQNGTVMGFSLSNNSIPPQEEFALLTSIKFEAETCNNEIILVDAEVEEYITIWDITFWFVGNMFLTMGCENQNYDNVDDCLYAGFEWDPIDCNFTWTNSFLNLQGDLNQDGEINVMDVILTVNIILEIIVPSNYQIWSADINSDGNINVLDVLGIVNIILE